ncbi:MAG: hypothetical protein IMZ43_09705 [Thermoplasmata archaeon]|nr:hypothetical protein [Thermoplasmata archaeon]
MTIEKSRAAIRADVSHRWEIFGNAVDIVNEKFEDGRDYAVTALGAAAETIGRLEEIAMTLNNIDVNIPIDDITPPDVGTFTGTLPVAPSISVNLPDDLTLVSDVENAIREKILHDLVYGGPAIPADVEEAIFSRENERALLIHHDNIDRISAEWSKRGFILPDGMLAALISQADIEYANKRLDVSRDISIKSFELGDQNTRFAIDKGISWYQTKIQTYQAKVQAEISRVNAIVQVFLGEAELYKAGAQVYGITADVLIKRFDVQVRAALMRAELIIKDAEIDMKNYEVMASLRIEAQKAIGAINAQIVAGALSSVSASASLSAGNAANFSYASPPYTSRAVIEDTDPSIAPGY